MQLSRKTQRMLLKNRENIRKGWTVFMWVSLGAVVLAIIL